MMKKRFYFIGVFLYDGETLIGSIKDNATLDKIENILNILNEVKRDGN